MCLGDHDGKDIDKLHMYIDELYMYIEFPSPWIIQLKNKLIYQLNLEWELYQFMEAVVKYSAL